MSIISSAASRIRKVTAITDPNNSGSDRSIRIGDDGLLYWKMPGGAWVRVNGLTWTPVTPPAVSQSVQFDGNSANRIQIAGFSNYDWTTLSPQITFECWVKGQIMGSGTGALFIQSANHQGSDNPLFAGFVDTSGFNLYIANGGGIQGYPNSYPSVPEVSNWHHIAYTYNQSTGEIRTFVDGVLTGPQTNSPLSIPQMAAELWLGPNLNSSTIQCRMSGVRVSKVLRYSTTFSLPTLAQSIAVDGDTLMSLAFTEGGGSSIADSSGNGRDGTIAGTLAWVADAPA